METYEIIGIMSGTSVDGLDIALCRFQLDKGKWNYEIIVAETVVYHKEWRDRLMTAHAASGEELTLTNAAYGRYIGGCINNFNKKHRNNPQYIASHGHTIFHQPAAGAKKGFTLQIGHGANIAVESGLPVICDFRSLDVALGGQGAPLVPVGDRLLFSDYEFCLNLGGFANISYEKEEQRIAFDICPVNILLNYYAGKVGSEYDKGGKIAKTGTLHTGLLNELNNLLYYHMDPPKSLGQEWIMSKVNPILSKYDLPVPDLLRTLTEHAALQIHHSTKNKAIGRMLVTGGGAFNTFLISRIRYYSGHDLFIPDPMLIQFKEAMIFAFLGALRLKGENNCLASVTGADKDSCGGSVFLA